MHDLTIPVAVFEHKEDNRPVRRDVTWSWLADRLCQFDERQDKDGRAWSPVTYRPGTTRGAVNVEQIHALVLDVDHSDLPVDLLNGLEYVAHTTFRHTPEEPRWRVVLPLTNPVIGEEWPEFWLRANAYFGGCVDPQTKDRSRIFYLPSCKPDAFHEAKQQHGLLLEPGSLPAVPQYEPPPTSTRLNGQIRSVNTDALSTWAASFCEAKIADLASMQPDTGRNSACNRIAHLLGGLAADERHGVTPDWIAQRLFDACESNRLVFEDGERSVRRTIQSGLRSGVSQPWSPADREDGWQPAPQLTVLAFKTDERTGEIVESPWQSLAELVSSKPDHQQEIVEGLLWAGRTHWLYSAPGVGKTLFVIAMLMHVADETRETFCGRAIEHGPVLLIEEDSPLNLLAEYISMISDVYGFDLTTLPFWVNRTQGVRITSPELSAAIATAMTAAPQYPKVLALDACERIVPSEKFSSKELEPLGSLLQKNAAQGIANIVIDHTRKSPTTATNQDPLDLLYGGRSKSAISDVMIHFSGAIKTQARLTFTKFRGQTPPALDVSFNDADGFKLRGKPREFTETERRIMEIINNAFGKWVTRDELEERSKLSSASLRRACAFLLECGYMERAEENHPARFRTSGSGPGMFNA